MHKIGHVQYAPHEMRLACAYNDDEVAEGKPAEGRPRSQNQPNGPTEFSDDSFNTRSDKKADFVDSLPQPKKLEKDYKQIYRIRSSFSLYFAHSCHFRTFSEQWYRWGGWG